MAEEQKYPAGRYRLRSEGYMPRMPGFDHELLAAGAEVVWAGRPGPHLEPLDEQAQKNYDKAGAAGMSLDPFASIPLTNAATDDDILAERIARAMGKVMNGPAPQAPDNSAREAALDDREAALAAREAVLAAREAAAAAPPVSPPPPPPPLPPPPPPIKPQVQRGK